ncbi:hypothetical protein YSY43_04830 [Paenibacillus sp. YSY-4.3]
MDLSLRSISGINVELSESKHYNVIFTFRYKRVNLNIIMFETEMGDSFERSNSFEW